ncbi:MAG: hypothetical protein ACREX3_20555, partial [Gammaproteobacteria bacterium]
MTKRESWRQINCDSNFEISNNFFCSLIALRVSLLALYSKLFAVGSLLFALNFLLSTPNSQLYPYRQKILDLGKSLS